MARSVGLRRCYPCLACLWSRVAPNKGLCPNGSAHRQTTQGIHVQSSFPEPKDTIVQEAMEHTQAEKTLMLVLQGASEVAGEDFFRLLMQYLAAALEVNLAFVAEIKPEKPGSASIIALFENEQFDEPFEYELACTPCEHVVRDRKAFFAANVAWQFPEDAWLAEHNIESYHGVPLLDAAGEAIGHMGVMHIEPMSMTIPREAILNVFAARASAELERQRAMRHLKQSAERYRSLVEAIRLGVQEITLDGTITFANRAHHEMFGYAPDEMVGMSILDLQTNRADREFLANYLMIVAEEMPVPTPYFAKNLTNSGTEINVRVDWDYKRDSDNRVTGFTSVLSVVDGPEQ